LALLIDLRGRSSIPTRSGNKDSRAGA
jgi:hypothetical protein